MQTLDNEELLFFVEREGLLTARVGKWCREPLVERLDRVEDFRQHEIEQGPQLGQIVLAISYDLSVHLYQGENGTLAEGYP